MILKARLEHRQTTSLTLTPQLRQSIALLQLSNLELTAAVAEHVERNPLLDLLEPADEAVPPGGPGDGRRLPAESSNHGGATAAPVTRRTDERPDRTAHAAGDEVTLTVSEPVSLHAHLMGQLGDVIGDPSDALIGAYLIGNVDGAGYLRTAIADAAEELDCDAERVERVLRHLQRLDPPGVLARDLAECLTLQLEERDRLDPAMKCLVDNLELVARGERRMLRRLCGVDDDDLDGMIAEIRSLDPKPGLSFAGEPAPLVVPDVIVRADDAGGWQVELNAETLPRLVINNAYRAHISARGKRPEKSYISECFNSAHWLIKALHQRSETILKVASEIFRRQEGFLTDGVMQLRPLVLRDIAEAVGLHESTVSRATSNKYVDTPRGVFELKYFFSSSIAGADGDELSGTSVRHRIGELIAAEDGNDILSDDRIAEMLKAEGIAIARRTVAKYREDLGIGSSTARRRARRLER